MRGGRAASQSQELMMKPQKKKKKKAGDDEEEDWPELLAAQQLRNVEMSPSQGRFFCHSLTTCQEEKMAAQTSALPGSRRQKNLAKVCQKRRSLGQLVELTLLHAVWQRSAVVQSASKYFSKFSLSFFSFFKKGKHNKRICQGQKHS